MTSFSRSLLLRLACIVSLSLSVTAGRLQAEEDIDFSRDIRPILADKCFACHGPDAAHREGGFRLDQKESALGTAESGEHPIVPGAPDRSELIARISSQDESLQMPPTSTNKPLTADEITLLKRWIAEGASWQEHWAFLTPQLPEPPAVDGQGWVRNEIDRFVLARLQQVGLTPNTEADRATLLRRVTFDLTGLPPTPEEVRAFLADNSPEAYEKVVDRLLASPRYGEHMARFWLDAARYGDTHGLHLDNYREFWPYRDWVVRAFNQNMPFDQFIVEQNAGDLLPNPTEDQLIATGFNRAHVTTSEGGSIAEEVRMRNVVERVTAFGTIFLGATFECTRCHDHKFDPVTMEDFYSLYAFFNSIDGSPLDGNKKDHAPVLKVPSTEQKAQLARYDAEIATLQQRLNGDWPELVAAQRLWEQALLRDETAGELVWETVIPQQFTSRGGAELALLDDQSLLASGTNPAQEVYEVQGRLGAGTWRGVRLEGLLHESLTNGGAGRSSNSNVVLTEFEVYSASAPAEGAEPNWQRAKLSKAWADHEQPDGDFKINNAIDGKPQTGWAIQGHAKKEPRTALFQFETPITSEAEHWVKVVLKHESIYAQHQFGRIRLALTQQTPIRTDVPAEILAIINIEPEQRDQKQVNQLQKHYREEVTTDAAYIDVRNQLAAQQKARTDLDNTIPTTLIWKEKAKPEPARILKRGEYDQPGDEVTRRTPLYLPPMPVEASQDRLGLAQWLIDPQNPLTARVTVNRFWQQLFGTGIVKTSEDFGLQGEPPSHPLLLDWLAVTFLQDGWDVKQLMKRMVLANSYRQASVITPEKLQRDRANRLLSRGPRFRLDAEMLRDQALFVGGLLVEQQGGPSVKPPQPDGLWKAVGYSGSNTVKFVADQGPEKVHRRTLYTFVKRTAPPPQMNIFDGPSREACTVRRERTNTPMQALLLFNDPQYVEAAIALATRGMTAGGDDQYAVARELLWLALQREPNSTEIDSLVQGYQADLETFQSAPEEAEKLVNLATTPVAADKAKPALAAWTMAANLLLNLDEVVTKN